MAGKGTISVNQTPVYGDKAQLEKMSEMTTTSPISGVAVERPTAGRPPGRKVEQTMAGEQQPAIPEEHGNMFVELRDAYRVYRYWQDVLAQYPSEWSRMYARESERIYQQKQMEARNSTPFFR